MVKAAVCTLDTFMHYDLGGWGYWVGSAELFMNECA